MKTRGWKAIIPKRAYIDNTCDSTSKISLLRKSLMKLLGYYSKVDIRKLKGNCEGLLIIKDGECRIIFKADWDSKTVEVIRIGHRKNVCRNC